MLRTLVNLVAGLTIATSSMLGMATAHHAPVSHTSQVVQTFNDGFTEGKTDDCQQGFQPACNWLHQTGR
jgi:hypothetical protein